MRQICFHCAWWKHRDPNKTRAFSARCTRRAPNPFMDSNDTCSYFLPLDEGRQEAYCRSCRYISGVRRGFSEDVGDCNYMHIKPCNGMALDRPRLCPLYEPVEDTPWKQVVR
jgi:hypothetical protein